MLFLLLAPFFLIFGTLIGVLYCSFRKSKKHWRDKNVPHKEPRFLSGNFAEAGAKNLGIIFRELYEEAKNEKVFGLWQFTLPVLLIIDLELVKKVLVSDFLHFDDHGVYFDKETDPLAVNLLTMGGSEWRNLRTKLNPAFTSGKLKKMFAMILCCGEELALVLRGHAEKGEVVEFKDWFARFTTDVISSCAFGIETNSLRNADAIFRTMGKKVFQSSWEVLWRNFVGFLFPDFARFFKNGKEDRKVPPPNHPLGVDLRQNEFGFDFQIRIYPKQLTDFFVGVIRETMHYRESNKVKRNDILQMLIQLKNEGFITDADSEKRNDESSQTRDKLTYEEAAAQAFIFFTAGFETSSTSMQYALYELAMNPEIQDRVRKEIQNVTRSHGGVTYESIQEMTYLGRVLDETLRKYPPATNLSRICTKEYTIPGTGIVLEKGAQVSVSVLGIHMDDRYYPDPEKFDPERFTEEQKASRPPYTYMPFGEGPRTCIGQRFGLTQIKVGLVEILSNYEVSVAPEKTQIPPVLDPKSFFSAPKGGMYLKISLVEDKTNRKQRGS